MELGVIEGTVRLAEHDPEWAEEAKRTIACLKDLLKGQEISDYQHVGSTSIISIPAKPIIDIAVAIKDESVVGKCEKVMTDAGYKYLGKIADDDWMYYIGHPGQNDRTHHIHFVTQGSDAWIGYLAFRDYLNANPAAAKKYEDTKRALAKELQNERKKYRDGKGVVVDELEKEALKWWNSKQEK